VGDIYFKDRQAHPETRIYTLSPEPLVLSTLFTPEAAPQVRSFRARVFRGHLEQGGVPVPGLESVQVTITRVLHARMFDPRTKNPERLEYLLVASGDETYLAHAIDGPPSFDQILAITLTKGHPDAAPDLRVVVTDRKNRASERLREGQKTQVTLGGGQAVQIDVGRQFYFEEGELMVPPTFQLTAEEKKG